MLHLKLLEKQEQAKPKTSRRREIIKIRAEINEIETKKTKTKQKNQKQKQKQKTQRFNKTKRWFFEKIKIDKPLANLTKMRENTQFNKIRNKNGEITTNTMEIQESSETTLRTCVPIN
jgi:hypothetical protein